MALKQRTRLLKISLPRALEKGIDLVIDAGDDFGVCNLPKERADRVSLMSLSVSPKRRLKFW